MSLLGESLSIVRWPLIFVAGIGLFIYGCVYDPEPPLACPREKAILTPEQATAFALEHWPVKLEGKEREEFLQLSKKSKPKFVKKPIVTSKAKWVWIDEFKLVVLVFDKCGKIIYHGAS